MDYYIDKQKSAKTTDKFIDYGTSGFRSNSDDLDHVLYRTGILSVLRSKKQNGATVGLMITASHNPDCDNGVKLIDPTGEMMEHSWEDLANLLINCDNDDIERIIQKIIADEHIDLSQKSSVFIGRDTRSSSPKLAQLAIYGITAFKGNYFDYGVVTTPVLHYLVYYMNKFSGDIESNNIPSQEIYNKKLTVPFNLLNKNNLGNLRYSQELFVDGANGVGALKVKDLLSDLNNLLKIDIYNDGNGLLNYKCGADYVKVNQKPPEGIPIKPNVRCVSLDGDADRLIYFYVDDQMTFHMLDGDRIAILIASYIMELISQSDMNLQLGLIQTAYANGNSTNYIAKELQVPVACVPTGVKHLHQKAKEFDIGVYFEANGHGTVICSEETEKKIKAATESDFTEPGKKRAAQNLMNLINVVNQTVGDAISDMLLVECILKAKDWNMEDWKKCYTDLPNRLLKVTIKDKNVIKTTDAGRICLKPEGLQNEINEFASKFVKGRAFVRPSGTEDVVRVYAEAQTQKEADDLALLVGSAVYRLAGGVGGLPSI